MHGVSTVVVRCHRPPERLDNMIDSDPHAVCNGVRKPWCHGFVGWEDLVLGKELELENDVLVTDGCIAGQPLAWVGYPER